MKTTSRRFVAAILLGIVFTVLLPAQELTTPKQGIDKLKSLPESTTRVLQVIKDSNFGPFEISGSCGYDSHFWCGGDCKKFSWQWKFPFYVNIKTELAQRYGFVQAISRTFNDHFSAVRGWLLERLPVVTEHMEITANQLRASENLFRIHAPQVVLDSAAGDIQKAIRRINLELQQSSNELNIAIRSMSVYNNNLSLVMAGVQEATDRAEARVKGDATGLRSTTGDWPCGGADAEKGYNGIQNTVRTQLASIKTASRQSGFNAGQAEKATSLILGTLITTQGSLNNAIKNLESAKITPPGAVQQLRLNVVAKQWRELSDYARQQFGN